MDSSSLKQLLDGFGLLLKPQTTPYRHISCHLVDLADLLVMPGAESTVVFSLPTGLVLDVDVANQVEEIIQVRSYRDRIKLLEYSQANEEALQLLRQIPLLAVVSSGDLVQLKATTPLSAFLTGHFLKTTSLAALNPYTYQGPVTGSRFFGRQEELRTLKLQTSKSFVLSGVRRSGKTSLMLELERQLRQAPNDLIVFVNFETCQKPKDIPYLILSRLAEEVKASTRLSEWSDNLLRLASSHQWKESEHFSHLLSTIWKLIYSNEEARRLRFLFDEYDTVIGMERLYNHVFTRIWRDLVMRARSFAKGQNVPVFVQFIFAGTRKLYDEIVSEASPFFNFGVERLPLHNFLLDTLNALVVKPMHSLGIAVQDAAGVAQELIVQTGGHPATTQHLLSLVVTDPQVDRERTVSRDDVRRAAGKHEFLGLLRDTLNMNVSPLGRFILAQMTIVGKERVNADFVQGVGTRHAVHFEESQLDVELQDLANSGYLRALDFKRGQSQYELAVPVVQHLFSSDDIADLVHEMLDRKLCTANLQRAGGGHAKTVS